MITLEPNKYILAVSGGVDSIVLLHKLRMNSDIVVAHFDHGIRDDSREDAQFVSELCRIYDLPFVAERKELGANASEAIARDHRYAFLRNVMNQHGAAAIITAHHQDDVIETAVINTIRGTKRRGFVSLQSTQELVRPLLNTSKAEIYDYALLNGLEWREDSTNHDQKYLRNKVRAQLKKTLNQESRSQLLKLLAVIETDNRQIDEVVNEILTDSEHSLARKFIGLQPPEIAAEVIAGWLRKNKATFNKDTILRLIKAHETLRNGSKIDIDAASFCQLSKDQITLIRRTSV